MAETAKWYVVHTYSGYENKVAATIQKTVENRKLEELIEDIRVPMETVTEILDAGSREVERKMFPGYVLIKMKMTDESWYVGSQYAGRDQFCRPGFQAGCAYRSGSIRSWRGKARVQAVLSGRATTSKSLTVRWKALSDWSTRY